MMADGSLLRSGGETWEPVSPDNVRETGVSLRTVPIPHLGRGGAAGRATRRKTWSRARSEVFVPYTARMSRDQKR
jgi:hypothetical protein